MSYTLLPSEDLENIEIDCITTPDGFLLKSSVYGISLLKELLKTASTKNSFFNIVFLKNPYILTTWEEPGFYDDSKTTKPFYRLDFKGSQEKNILFMFRGILNCVYLFEFSGGWKGTDRTFKIAWGDDSVALY